MKAYLKLLLILIIPMALAMGYAFSTFEIGKDDYVLEKADLPGLKRMFPWLLSDAKPISPVPASPLPPSPSPVAADTVPPALPDSALLPVVAGSRRAAADSLPVADDSPSAEDTSRTIKVHQPDMSKYRIMIFGDSMLEWLAKRLCDYALENDYDLSSIIWYSSSTKLWATTDTLQYFLDRIRPDYVMLCLGGNELFVRDLPKREKYIDTIVRRIGDRPFLWIGPPNWKKDTGINDLIRQRVGEGRFFDSRELELDRAEDNMHPTRSAAALWMDTIASWLNGSEPMHPLKMDRPTQARRRVYHKYMLRPPQ